MLYNVATVGKQTAFSNIIQHYKNIIAEMFCVAITIATSFLQAAGRGAELF